MSHERKFEYLTNNRIVYRRDPISDKPDEETPHYKLYNTGTHECYELFRSKAKITTFKSLKWHLLVLLYLNDHLTKTMFLKLGKHITNKSNGFITFVIEENRLVTIVDDVWAQDLNKPPKNRLRKIIFKDNCGLNRIEKLKLVGKVLGRGKKASESDMYEAMLYMHDVSKKITVKSLATQLQVTTRTIFRNMSSSLKEEKQRLNDETLQCKKLHTLQGTTNRKVI